MSPSFVRVCSGFPSGSGGFGVWGGDGECFDVGERGS